MSERERIQNTGGIPVVCVQFNGKYEFSLVSREGFLWCSYGVPIVCHRDGDQ
jgi:hypothetical protein